MTAQHRPLLASSLLLVTVPADAALDLSAPVTAFHQDTTQAIIAVGLATLGIYATAFIVRLLIKEISRAPATVNHGNLRHIPRYKTRRAKDYVYSSKDELSPHIIAAENAKDKRFIANRNATFLNHPALFSQPCNAFGLPSSGLGSGPYYPYPHFYEHNPELIPAAPALDPELTAAPYDSFDDYDYYQDEEGNYTANYELTQQIALEVDQEAFGDTDPDPDYDDNDPVHPAAIEPSAYEPAYADPGHYHPDTAPALYNFDDDDTEPEPAPDHRDRYDFALPRETGISLTLTQPSGYEHHRIMEKFFNPPSFQGPGSTFGGKDFTEYTEAEHAEIRRVTEELQQHIKSLDNDPNTDPALDEHLHPETHPDK